MVCSFVDPDKIKEWIQLCKLMKEMNKVVCLCFKEKELTLQMKHDSNRSVVDMTFPSSWFSFYDWKETKLYVPTDSFFTIFSRYSGEKIISLESEKNYLMIKCFHEKQNKHYSIPVLNYYYTSIMVHVDPCIEFNIDSTLLYTNCKELYSLDEHVRFHHTKEFFHLISQTRQHEKMVVELLPSSIEQEEFNEQTYENTFDLTYLLLFLKCSSLYSKINVRLSNVLFFSIQKEYKIDYYICSIKS